MKVIGITGPSGSGKSRIAGRLREQGYPVVDMDSVARNIRPQFVGDVKKLFGAKYLKKDGSIDAHKLAILVFNDREKLKKLNALMFPVLLDEIQKIIEEYKTKSNVEILFFDIAVLFNSGAEKFFDHIVLVTAPRLLRLERLIANRHIPEKVAQAQVDSIFITHIDIDNCDLILINMGNEDEIEKKLNDWIKIIKVGEKDGQDRTSQTNTK